MTRDDIIRMARSDDWAADVSLKWDDFFVRFAALVAAAEREACAKAALDAPLSCLRQDTRESCADAIRARGQS